MAEFQMTKMLETFSPPWKIGKWQGVEGGDWLRPPPADHEVRFRSIQTLK